MIENAIITKIFGASVDERAIYIAKRVVRGYDPCISCSVHLVNVDGA